MPETYCFISAQYLPTAGGVERYTYNMAKELIHRGHRVIVVTSTLPGLSDYEVTFEGIIIYRVPALLLLNGRMPLSYPGKKWRDTCKALDQQNISRIVIQTRLYTLSIMGMNYASKRHIPFILIEHGTNYVGIQNKLLGFAERQYENLMMSIARRKTTEFFTVSKAGFEWLKRFQIKAKGVLYNSVDPDAIQRYLSEPSEDVRTRYSIPETHTLICYVGRLIPEKGVLQLIDSVLDMKELPITLLIAGNGPLLSSLQSRKLPSNIILMGEIEQRDVMHLLRASDIFCLPSDAEGFPTSILEAVICRCYVITTTFGGAKELISTPEYGRSISSNSKEAIKEALLDAITHTEMRQIAINNAYQRFFEQFTWNITCDNLENLNWRH
ncbi:glycosyltransferase family 4 protein [Oscillospiraceae bacterium HV4-5-C5C]|nr:glycosyltransferase family 4 protein [Oscillospiraceae bacterium HV4-5-C5C]